MNGGQPMDGRKKGGSGREGRWRVGLLEEYRKRTEYWEERRYTLEIGNKQGRGRHGLQIEDILERMLMELKESKWYECARDSILIRLPLHQKAERTIRIFALWSENMELSNRASNVKELKYSYINNLHINLRTFQC